MEDKNPSLKIRLILGLVSLILGFYFANLALFQWVERTNIYYLFGNYVRYACAYGGFAAMMLGSALVNDFLCFRATNREEMKTKKRFPKH